MCVSFDRYTLRCTASIAVLDLQYQCAMCASDGRSILPSKLPATALTCRAAAVLQHNEQVHAYTCGVYIHFEV
jgi:hypothetical protein